ncbi:NADP-dependent 3-hydroxy acid dehydrogenase YdfG [Geodermatophilus ruber]|uniref:NADP-dependent 3-hydroxy acid dehydrogenase YdfG n=2 Tax=Geodermatophilus ruber TaxID=504800 RepID=A0A1I4C9X2_9ACTN|nr:NADP-dependent 3-hydroxy acid dehydrogenase YdfG [Geodermatophilus ruber]
MKDLVGKVAVVTGGASGIGYAMAARFHAEGMKVVVADIEDDALVAAVARLSADGGAVVGQRTDVSDLASVESLAERAVGEFGRVDVLCNNAGVDTGGSFLGIPDTGWRWVMDVNFYGVLNGCRVFLPLLAQQDEGHIVNTGSVASFHSGTPTMTPYCVSKFAVLGLTECLDIELRATGSPVRVSLLAPGPVRTRMPQAERNLPSHVPPAAEPERLAVLEGLARKATDEGLEPSHVAAMVVEAVREERFFILPHPDMALAGVRKRLTWMETGRPPAPRVAGT